MCRDTIHLHNTVYWRVEHHSSKGFSLTSVLMTGICLLKHKTGTLTLPLTVLPVSTSEMTGCVEQSTPWWLDVQLCEFHTHLDLCRLILTANVHPETWRMCAVNHTKKMSTAFVWNIPFPTQWSITSWNKDKKPDSVNFTHRPVIKDLANKQILKVSVDCITYGSIFLAGLQNII